jgi:hypothetical protein
MHTSATRPLVILVMLASLLALERDSRAVAAARGVNTTVSRTTSGTASGLISGTMVTLSSTVTVGTDSFESFTRTRSAASKSESSTVTLSSDVTASRSVTQSDSAASRSASADATTTRTLSHTLPLSVSKSLEASSTTSKTFEGAAWLCRSVELTASIQQIYPAFGVPVQSGRGRLTVPENVIKTTGVVATVNITSCHSFYTELQLMVPKVVANESTGTAPTDVLELLLAGATTSIVASAGEGLGSFVRLVEQNPSLLKFTAETPRSGLLQIGPDPLYGTTQAETTLITLDGAAYFKPPARQNLQVTLVVLPDEVPAPVAERTAASGLAYAAAVLSILIGTAQTPTIAGRIGAVYSAIDCPITLSADVELRADQNIVRASFGTEKKLQWVVGGAVFNPVLVFGVAAFAGFVVAVLAVVSGRTIEEVMTLLRFPGILAPAVMFVLQGTVFTAAATLTQSRSFIPTFFACAALLSVFLFFIMVVMVTFPGPFDVGALRSGAETAARPLHPALKFMFTSGKWIDRGGNFVGPMGGMFKEYLPGRQWFLAVEIVVSVVLGSVEGSLPENSTSCIFANAVQALTFWLHLVVVVGMHPYIAPPAFITTIATSLFLLVPAVIAAVAPVLDPAQRPGLANAVDGLLLTAACFAMLKGVLDAVAAGYRIVMRREIDRGCREWQQVRLRQLRISAARQRREKRIMAALQDSNSDAAGSGTESDPDSLDEAAASQPAVAAHASSRSVVVRHAEGDDAEDGGLPHPSHPDRGVPLTVLRRMPHYDDRGVSEMRSSVKPAERLPRAEGEEEEEETAPRSVSAEAALVERTGMTRAELLAAL